MKLYGDGSQDLRDAEGLLSFRPYHVHVWMTIWLYSRDDAEREKVEEWLWRVRLRQMGLLRDDLS